MNKVLKTFQQELNAACLNILDWWTTYTIDEKQGGFFGRIDNDNKVCSEAPKGAVLNSRILWTFSAAYKQYNNQDYLITARRAYEYIHKFFIDEEFGGVYWTVDYEGRPLDTKKQVYAIAFAVYGLSEYYSVAQNEEAKQLAITLYNTIEKYSHDTVKGGYIEALTREWNELPDLRLSAKDSNEKKSMNTHLHVLEAYASLYKVWPDAGLKKNIADLIKIFTDHIINPATHHLILFFDEDWKSRSQVISYGHDIEAAWLIQEAAETIADEKLIKEVKEISIKVADAAARGFDIDGGLWYEKDVAARFLIREKHWWPQAEALVGFYNTWQTTGEEHYLLTAINTWQFIQQHILDKKNGEWFWGIDKNGEVMPGEDKAGLWKCPYHNGRACMELDKRITIELNGN